MIRSVPFRCAPAPPIHHSIAGSKLCIHQALFYTRRVPVCAYHPLPICAKFRFNALASCALLLMGMSYFIYVHFFRPATRGVKQSGVYNSTLV
jgi:hypothetical protein